MDGEDSDRPKVDEHRQAVKHLHSALRALTSKQEADAAVTLAYVLGARRAFGA